MLFGSLLVTMATCASVATAQDWSNAGGNAGRNGLTTELGPDAPDVLWSGAPSSIIAWQPVIEGRRVYVVRQNGFPPEPASNESPILCLDLDTGAEHWRINIPFVTGDWTTWVAGVKDGRLYAARSGNGATSVAPLRCYDSVSGAFLWESDATITSGFYDGVVFSPDTDPIVADFQNVTRISHADGSTVWRVPRLCSVSGNCGGAATDSAVFVVDAAPGGHVVRKLDIDTGALLYESPIMPGFTLQNSPMVGPDGTVYVSRTQNNALVDFFYAFHDDGSSLTEKWSVPAQWTTSDELAVGPDGSVYFVAPGFLLTRLDPATGEVVDQHPTPIDNDGTGLTPRLAIDREGRVFLTNGAFANGRLYSFDADLTPRWSVPFTNVNIGGPSMGADGTLVIAGVGSNMIAYRTEHCIADLAEPFGTLDFSDVLAFLSAFGAMQPAADLAPPTGVFDFSDVLAFLAAFGAGCP